MKKKSLIKLIVVLSAAVLLGVFIFSKASDNEKNSNYKSFKGGDGSTLEKAVLIGYVGNYPDSIAQEYAYISSLFGVRGKDWQLVGTVNFEKNSRSYDRTTIRIISSGGRKEIYFDITVPFQELLKQLHQMTGIVAFF